MFFSVSTNCLLWEQIHGLGFIIIGPSGGERAKQPKRVNWEMSLIEGYKAKACPNVS